MNRASCKGQRLARPKGHFGTASCTGERTTSCLAGIVGARFVKWTIIHGVRIWGRSVHMDVSRADRCESEDCECSFREHHVDRSFVYVFVPDENLWFNLKCFTAVIVGSE